MPPLPVVLRGIAISMAYQLTIMGMLIGTVAAMGEQVHPLALLGVFGASQVAGILPGVNGASPREGALVVGLASVGVTWQAALGAVALTALLAWVPALLIGGAAFAVRRLRPATPSRVRGVTAPADPRRMLAIAHRSGNTVAGLREALDAGVDLVEADVHAYRGRLEVRHLRSMGGLPFLWDREGVVRRRPHHRLVLADLIEALGDDHRLMIDLKGVHPRLAPKVARLLRESSPTARSRVCTKSLVDAGRVRRAGAAGAVGGHPPGDAPAAGPGRRRPGRTASRCGCRC